MTNETIPFWEAMKALEEGKEVEYFNTFDKQWTVFKHTTSLEYVFASDLKWRIKEQKKRMAKALCKDSSGDYFETEYYYESIEKVSTTFDEVIRFPHGEWIDERNM